MGLIKLTVGLLACRYARKLSGQIGSLAAKSASAALWSRSDKAAGHAPRRAATTPHQHQPMLNHQRNDPKPAAAQAQARAQPHATGNAKEKAKAANANPKAKARADIAAAMVHARELRENTRAQERQTAMQLLEKSQETTASIQM